MPETLRTGSRGPAVTDLQQKLNLIPSQLARLTPDGVYGPKTAGRVREFQGDTGLTPDGVVGPLTWEQLVEVISGVKGDPTNNLGRLAVVAVARAEASVPGVAATLPGDLDTASGRVHRQGWDRLLKYFRTSAPLPGSVERTFYNEDDISYLTLPGVLAPMKSWCGIFALWAIKTAGMQVGTWIDGRGISDVAGFRLVHYLNVDRGDVGYVDQPYQHHFLVDEVYKDQFGVRMARTIEGNSDPTSNFNFKTRQLSKVSGFYTCF